MTIAKVQTGNIGANPFSIEGPFPSTVTGSGLPGPNFTLGYVSYGDSEAEWVYCKMTLAGTTTITPGMWMQWDKDYNAIFVTTATAVVGQRAGILSVTSAPLTVSGGPIGNQSLLAGVYYVWVQRAGQAPAVVSGTITPNLVVAETTATAGTLACPASPTATTKQITPVSFSAANFAFTGTITNGSPIITVLSAAATTGSGPFIGATVAGTGIPGATTVTGITLSPSGTLQTITMSANATASTAALAITATLVLEVSLQWAYVAKVN